MKINEIFYSLQGEGRWSGRPAIFVRFSGCNLRCPFCDTLHQEGKEMSEEEIVAEIEKYPARFVVLTGGEPSLFITNSLIEKIHQAEKAVAVETNGTHAIEGFPDWVTCSPKDKFCPHATPIIKSCNELKVVFDGTDPEPYKQIYTRYRYLQPCDTGDKEKNEEIIQKAIEYVKANPEWSISLQTHKLLNIR